jgi:butyryl-CoA dehydrogenase
MMKLDYPLDDEARAFLASVEEFNRTEVAPYADQWDHDEQLPREIFTKAGKLGIMGIVAPKEYGGRGLSYVTSALAVKELGKTCASLAMDIAAHNALSVGQINVFGTDEQSRNTSASRDDRPDRGGQERDQRLHHDEGSTRGGAEDSHLRHARE